MVYGLFTLRFIDVCSTKIQSHPDTHTYSHTWLLFRELGIRNWP